MSCGSSAAAPGLLLARDTEQVVSSLRDVVLDTWAAEGELSAVLGALGRGLAAGPLAANRVSLAILPAYASLDGLQWIWSASQPAQVASVTRPPGFLESLEHQRSALHQVLTTGAALRQRLDGSPVLFESLNDLARQGMTDYLAMPLPQRNVAPAVLSLATNRPGGWLESDLAILERVAPVLALLVTVAESRRLLEVAATDPLTGLANRRSFESSARQAWAMCQRSRAPLSVMYMDVDYFKAYNDTYGHLAGDSCLARVAGTVSRAAGRRATDLVARIGGEEFAALLPDCPPQVATEIAERVRSSVEAQGLPHVGSRCSDRVTISVGVFTAASHQHPVSELLRLADEALYAAKESGRNRVVLKALAS